MPVQALKDGWLGGRQKWTAPDLRMNLLVLEAMAKNVPLPKVYVRETETGDYNVLVGGDIISTCLHYLEDPRTTDFRPHQHRSVRNYQLDIVILHASMTDAECESVLRMVQPDKNLTRNTSC
jgi:hypothetical protein